MDNQLQVIVRDSGLETTKAQYILTKFQDYFAIAAEWETRAKTIVVTDEAQKVDMQMARTGRLFLREKRLAVEQSRKELKEQSLREGKAIDGIANVLKALIVPIEEYLEKQERFVEIKAAEVSEMARIAAEQRFAQEIAAQQKAKQEEDARVRAENEALKIEMAKKAKEAAELCKKHEAEIAEEQAKANAERIKQAARLTAVRAKADAEREALEAKAKADREKQEMALANQKAAAEAQRKALEEKAAKERAAEKAKADAERKEKERLLEALKNQVECPKCHCKFSIG